jgi:hypothetical protein
LLGVSLAWDVGVTVALFAAAYLLLLVAVARALRERRRGTALAATACIVGVVSALLVPLTWGMSSFLAAFALPLTLPGLVTSRRARWLAWFALLLNTALTVMLALIWFS